MEATCAALCMVRPRIQYIRQMRLGAISSSFFRECGVGSWDDAPGVDLSLLVSPDEFRKIGCIGTWLDSVCMIVRQFVEDGENFTRLVREGVPGSSWCSHLKHCHHPSPACLRCQSCTVELDSFGRRLQVFFYVHHVSGSHLFGDWVA